MRVEKGLTLVEVLIVIVILALMAVAIIVTINPVEQLRKAKDSAREKNAETLLNAISRYQVTQGDTPEINDSTNSVSCEDIVRGAPVYEADSLGTELSDWFLKHIAQTNSEIYVGFNREGDVKVCYQVEASINKAEVDKGGCVIAPLSYLCLPR